MLLTEIRLSNMDLDLKSKTAVVTGASIGIGRAIAKALALEGVRVVAVARRNDLLGKLAQEVLAEGGAAVIPVVQDIMQQDAAKKLAAAALAAVGHVGIRVNNAGGSRNLPKKRFQLAIGANRRISRHLPSSSPRRRHATLPARSFRSMAGFADISSSHPAERQYA